MKKFLIFTLLSLISFISFSQNQNGGQFNENNSVRLQYMGYSSGTHTFKIVNKQNCQVNLRTKIDQESPIDMPTLPNDSFYVNVPRTNPGNVKFRVKTETACSQNIDMGWIELNTSGFALPLVEDNIIRFVRGQNEYKVEMIGYTLKSDFGQLSEKQTVVIHNMVGETLEFRRIFVNKRNQVDLYPFMVRGLNLVTVFIDNKTKDIFTFKIFKY
jgi:hypothetical protein